MHRLTTDGPQDMRDSTYTNHGSIGRITQRGREMSVRGPEERSQGISEPVHLPRVVPSWNMVLIP
jgi:hypothetical protein